MVNSYQKQWVNISFLLQNLVKHVNIMEKEILSCFKCYYTQKLFKIYKNQILQNKIVSQKQAEERPYGR